MIRNTAFVILLLAIAGNAFPQVGTLASPSPTSQAIPLPVSARSQQSGSVTAVQLPVPGTTTSVNTINPSVLVQGPYIGSTPSILTVPFSGKLSLHEAIERGLAYNLGPVGLNELVRQARGQNKVARSVLLPNLTANIGEALQQNSLRVIGVGTANLIPGFAFPQVVGPFNYIDFRARLTQTIVDFTALNNYRSVEQTVR